MSSANLDLVISLGIKPKFCHDSVLTHLLDTIIKNKKREVTVYVDRNGWRVNGGTVPPDLVFTEQISDLVIIDKSTAPTKVVLLAFQAVLDRKTARYERLADDLQR